MSKKKLLRNYAYVNKEMFLRENIAVPDLSSYISNIQAVYDKVDSRNGVINSLRVQQIKPLLVIFTICVLSFAFLLAIPPARAYLLRIYYDHMNMSISSHAATKVIPKVRTAGYIETKATYNADHDYMLMRYESDDSTKCIIIVCEPIVDINSYTDHTDYSGFSVSILDGKEMICYIDDNGCAGRVRLGDYLVEVVASGLTKDEFIKVLQEMSN